MENLSEKSSLLLSRLPQITDLKELIDLSCSLLQSSLYIVDGQGIILEHSARENVNCESWLNAVAEGRLSEAHRKSVLTPEVNCNVIRDKACKGTPCARLSIPIRLEDGLLPGAVIFFLWDNDPSLEKQYLAVILAGAISNLLQKERQEKTDAHQDSAQLLRDLLNYKPGLKLYFSSALKSSEFAGMPGHFRLCILVPGEDGRLPTEQLLQKVTARSGRLWVFEYLGQVLVLFNSEDFSPETFRPLVEPLLETNHMQACCSIGFDDLLKLRYIYEDTFSALGFACRDENKIRFHKSERYLSLVLLQRCRKTLPAEEYYPDFFRRLIEHDKKTGKTYLETLSAYLDSGRNTNAAAKKIYMHRNTMVQQLERIEQILGISLEDSETVFFLQLCIRLYKLQ